jgi:acyl-CoA synthetase (AMP-forming)/AMP-acid ligase II
MMSRLIFDELVPSGRTAIIAHGRSITWEDLREEAHNLLKAHSALTKRRVGLLFGSDELSYAALAALERLQCDVFLLDAQLPLPEALNLAEKFKLGALLTKKAGDIEMAAHELAGEERWSGNGTVTILTSGSTGEPKAVRHSWNGISHPVRKTVGALRPPIWLLTYRPHLYAGLQVILQCFADLGTLVLSDPEMDPQAVAELMLKAGVRFVSATPSYWRRLLLFAERDLLSKIPITQITLGGEVVDQPILDRLRSLYPSARLVHIYATTEMGRCFSVTDGLAGLPDKYLYSVLADGTEMRVVEGELVVRTPNSMCGYDPLSKRLGPISDWFGTGDLIDLRDGRAYFVGRISEMINVAGNKVYPVEVERTIRDIPGVIDVRVFGKASSIAGELVACEVVPHDGQDHNTLKDLIARTCRDKLTGPQQPRLIRFVRQIDLSAAGKMTRTKTS